MTTGDRGAYRGNTWTQPVCDDCWDESFRHRLPAPAGVSPRAGEGALETCCRCGQHTRSGIYVRVDPTTVPYPSVIP